MKLQEYREFKIIHKYIVRVKWVIPLHRYSFIFWICLIGYFSLRKTVIIQITLQNKKAVPHNKQQKQCQKPPLEANTQHAKTLSFSCPLSTLTNAYTALRLCFLSLNQRKKWIWDFIINLLIYYMQIKSGSNLLISTSTRMFFIFLGKPITTLPRGSWPMTLVLQSFIWSSTFFFLAEINRKRTGNSALASLQANSNTFNVEQQNCQETILI